MPPGMRQRWTGMWDSAAIWARVAVAAESKMLDSIANAEDGAIADFCRGSLGAGLEGDDGEVIRDEAAGGEFHGADEADFLRAGEEADAGAFGFVFIEVHEGGDDDGAADEVVASACVDEAIAKLELGEVPHGEAAIAADVGIGEGGLGDAAEELHGVFLAGEIGDGAEGFFLDADPAGVIHVCGEGEAGGGRGGGFRGVWALVEGDEVAVFVALDGDVGKVLEEAEDGLCDGLLMEGGGGPGDDVPEHGQEFPPSHGGAI